MSYGGYDSDDLSTRHVRLAREVGDLDRQLHDLTRKVDELGGQIEEQASKWRNDLRSEVGDVRDDLDGLGTELRTELDGLARRVDLAERRTRRAAGSVADLDAVDDTLRVLVDRAAAGQAATDALLDPPARTRHQRTVERFTDLQVAITTGTDQLVAIARTLADTHYGTPKHSGALHAFRQARHHLQTNTRGLPAARSAAAKARQALNDDDTERGVHGPRIMTGDAAHTTLYRQLRDRIAAALDGDLVLPVWFTTVLGFQPPATNADTWIQTATAVLTFRVVHHIADPVVALGPRPDSADQTSRAANHRRLTTQLELLRKHH